MKTRFAVLLLLLTVIALPTFGQGDAAPRRIFFAAYSDYEYYFRSINPDGSDEQRIAQSVSSIFSPSPDGTQFLHLEARNLDAGIEHWQFDIYLSGSDGSNPIRLTDNGSNYAPRWSPSGAQIAFSHTQDNESSIQVIQRNQLQSVATIFHSSGEAGDPIWSPGEKALAFFTCDAQRICDLNTIQADGSALQTLTSDFEPSVLSFAWSPDGKQVGFIAYEDGDISKANIYTNDLATKKIAKITNNLAEYLNFAWAADSQSIVFTSNLGGSWEIYKVNLENGEQTDLTNTPNLQDGFDGLDISYPDNSIVYTTSPFEGYIQIFTMSFDGSNKKQITSDEIHKTSPVWGL